MGLLAPLGKLIVACFGGFIAWEVYSLYTFCQPPLAAPGDEARGRQAPAVAWDLRQEQPLDVRLYLSLSERPPSPDVIAAGPDASSTTHVFVGEFAGVEPRQSPAVPDVRVEDLQLPAGFFRNATVLLHAVAARPGRGAALRHEAVRLSRQVLQPDRREHRRRLLVDPPRPLAEARKAPRPVASLPRVAEVGFVQEVKDLSPEGLAQQGLSGLIVKDKVKLPLYVNTLVSPRDEYSPLLQKGPAPSLTVRFRSIGMGYWTLQQQLGMAFDEAEQTYGLNEYDVDSFKQMIGGSSPFKIMIVYGVTLLHLVFYWMALREDIDFWRAKTSFEGLSSSSVAMQVGTNLLMFLYVQEQGQTRFVMYFIGLRLSLNLWKLRKLTAVERCQSWPFVRWVNRQGANAGLEEMAQIHEAERRCMRWLALLLVPVVGLFCGYRLVFQQFRSWYSWLVLSLAVCAQMGGFVVMTPQVFMNYRLKSVEHLPWRALTYQAINTFIDDVFTFCIRMPELQKYSAFRDDVVFLICCYQRWLYRKPQRSGAAAPSCADGDAIGERERAKKEE